MNMRNMVTVDDAIAVFNTIEALCLHIEAYAVTLDDNGDEHLRYLFSVMVDRGDALQAEIIRSIFGSWDAVINDFSLAEGKYLSLYAKAYVNAD